MNWLIFLNTIEFFIILWSFDNFTNTVFEQIFEAITAKLLFQSSVKFSSVIKSYY